MDESKLHLRVKVQFASESTMKSDLLIDPKVKNNSTQMMVARTIFR